jgi:hypothetical protein
MMVGSSASAGIRSDLSNPASTNSLNGSIEAVYNFNSLFESDRVKFSTIERFQITGTIANDQISTGSGNDTILGGAGTTRSL